MKLSLQYFFILFFISGLNYSQDWVKTEISDFASIDFPVKSELTKTQNKTVFSANDGFAIYIVSLSKLTNSQSAQITKDQILNLYKGVANGAVSAAKAELISSNEITIDNNPALDLEYYTSANPNLPSKRFKRIIYINKTIISIDAWVLTDQKKIFQEKKSQFFNSFSITQNKIESDVITSDNKEVKPSTAYQTGFLLGKLIFYLILAIGLFFIVRKIFFKKKKTKLKFTETPLKEIRNVTCTKCDTENSSNTKYCKRCGYSLNQK